MASTRVLTPGGHLAIEGLGQRYGVSVDAVRTLRFAVAAGGGTLAQFYHPELGGNGQWMRGGMTMVGDMFNHGLKAKVDGLCNELSQLLDQQPFVAPAPVSQSQWQGGSPQPQGGYGGGPFSLFVPESTGGSGSWWPAGLGS